MFECTRPFCKQQFATEKGYLIHRRLRHQSATARRPPVQPSQTVAQQTALNNRVRISAETASEIHAEEDVPYNVQEYPNAAWACSGDGSYLAEQTPPPGLNIPAEFNASQPFAPFQDKPTYDFARMVIDHQMSDMEVQKWSKLVGSFLGAEPPFRNTDHVRSFIDQIPYADHTQWYKRTVYIDATQFSQEEQDRFPFYKNKHTLYLQDSRLVLLHLLQSPQFIGHQNLVPVKITDKNGYRLVSKPYTAERAWTEQDKLPPRWAGVSVGTSQDSTLCTSGTGGHSEHPVYLTTSVNSGYFRRPGRRGALMPVAFMPKMSWSGKTNDEAYRRYVRLVQHACMQAIFTPLVGLMKEGELVRFSDGHYRHTKCYLGPVSVDYPEACWLAGIRGGRVAW